MKEILKKKRIYLLLTIILGLGLSLASIYFMYHYRDNNPNSLVSGLISIDFNDNGNTINLSSSVPLIDAIGIEDTTPYVFTIKNTSKVMLDVDIKLDIVTTENKIHNGAVRFGLFINDKLVKKDYIHDNLILYTYESMNIDETINCKIYFWVDYYYDIPGETFVAKIIAEGKNSETVYKPVTVTFDANGGEVSVVSKEVGVGQNYGDLPTPTRNGYEFLGWNGKNLFNYEEILINNPDTVTQVELKGVQTISWINTNTTNNQKFLQGYFKENTQYTFSGNIAATKVHNNYLKIVYNNKSEENVNLSNYIKETNVFYNVVFLSQNNMSVNYIRGLYNNNEQVYLDINSFQIEEGTKATEYEPYYITSDTKVVQINDHTLKAIWKENS